MNLLLRDGPPSNLDLAALGSFTCTSRRSAAPWEAEVEDAVRSLPSLLMEGDRLLIGEDEIGLASVCVWSPLATPGNALIRLIAVATRRRRQGGDCADLTLSKAVVDARAHAEARGARRLLLSARIHFRNAASHHLFRRHGFFRGDWAGRDLEDWGYLASLTA